MIYALLSTSNVFCPPLVIFLENERDVGVHALNEHNFHWMCWKSPTVIGLILILPLINVIDLKCSIQECTERHNPNTNVVYKSAVKMNEQKINLKILHT